MGSVREDNGEFVPVEDEELAEALRNYQDADSAISHLRQERREAKKEVQRILDEKDLTPGPTTNSIFVRVGRFRIRRTWRKGSERWDIDSYLEQHPRSVLAQNPDQFKKRSSPSVSLSIEEDEE